MAKRTVKILNFDEAIKLARTDHTAFDHYCHDVMQALIIRAPKVDRRRLRCKQWRMHAEWVRDRHAHSACIQLYRLLWESFADTHEPDYLKTGNPSAETAETRLPKAKVLPFRRSASS
jgi:hypothetical protein